MTNKDKLIEIVLNDCWKYHKDIILDCATKTKRKDLEEFLNDCNFEDWEDIGWFTGYIEGLRTNVNKALKMQKHA
jgi:hypothetical protein